VLFGFLLLIVLGLAAIASWRGPEWLHHVGGASAVFTFFVWLSVSYTHESWPWSLVWLAAFVALYLVKTSYASALLFFAFTGLANREPKHDIVLTDAMLALLVIVFAVTWRKGKLLIAATAVALSSISLMMIAPFHPLLLGAHALLFVAILVIAALTEQHILAVLAIPFYVAMLITANTSGPYELLLFAFVPFALFIAFAFYKQQSRLASLAACLASAVFFFPAWDALKDLGYKDVIGLLPLAQALVLVALFWRNRFVFVAGTALAFITAAIPLQFEKEWIIVWWALEATALAWLYTRVRHAGLLVWSSILSLTVLLWLLADTRLHDDRGVFFTCAAAMFVAAYLDATLRALYAAAGTIELFALLNFEIANYYEDVASSLGQDLTYTIAWAAFALVMLIIGIALRSRVARIAALGLLLVTVLKCFLHDLAQLGGLYRVASLFGLAVSLVLVGLLLQKFVIARAEEPAA
jgi:hypothetical protein